MVYNIYTYMKTIKINQMEVNIPYMDPMGKRVSIFLNLPLLIYHSLSMLIQELLLQKIP